MADTIAEPEAEFSPPKSDPETGLAMVGGYPLNHRLRAEAMAAANVGEDEHGIIAADDIAAAGERVSAEAKDASAAERAADDAAKAAARELRGLTLEKLRELAAAEGVVVEGDANKSTIVDAIEAARAAKLEG